MAGAEQQLAEARLEVSTHAHGHTGARAMHREARTHARMHDRTHARTHSRVGGRNEADRRAESGRYTRSQVGTLADARDACARACSLLELERDDLQAQLRKRNGALRVHSTHKYAQVRTCTHKCALVPTVLTSTH